MEDTNNFQLPPIQTPTEPQLPPLLPQPESQIPQPVDTQKTSIRFYIISIIIILFLSLACYLLAFRSKDIFNLINKKNTNNSVSKTSQQLNNNTTINDLKNLSPKETYLRHNQEWNNIKNYNDYLSWMNKYVTKEILKESESHKQEIMSSFNNGTFKENMSKHPSINQNITNIEENINGNEARLYMTANEQSKKLTGNAVLILEDGLWKIKIDDWVEL